MIDTNSPELDFTKYAPNPEKGSKKVWVVVKTFSKNIDFYLSHESKITFITQNVAKIVQIQHGSNLPKNIVFLASMP